MKKVLVVDDEKYILDEIQEALTEEGYHVHTATSVDDAFRLLMDETDISLVITDLKMPEKTGMDLISSAQAKINRDIQFVIISGHAYSDNENGGSEDNIIRLRKPLDIEELIQCVNAFEE